MEFLKNIEICKIAGHFKISRKSRNFEISKIREIMKTVITKSFFKLGPSNFAWKLTKDPFIGTKTCFFVFPNFGVLLGGGNAPKIKFVIQNY